MSGPAQKGRDKDRKGTWARRIWWLHSVWALSAGIAVMVYAGQNFAHARWVLLMLVAAFLLIVAFYRVFGARPAEAATTFKRKVGFVAMTYALKNLYQGMLFFLLPFYWRSATLGSSNQWFVLLLALAAFTATMDLLFDHVLMRWKIAASTYFVITLFAAINLAIPALLPGFDARWALFSSCALATLGFAAFHVRRDALKDRRVLGALGLALALSLGAGYLVRPLVPPVPYHVLSGAVGPELLGGRLSYESRGVHVSRMAGLKAQTRVLAPQASDSFLRHVWRHGKEVVFEPSELVVMRDPGEPNVITLTSTLPADKLPSDLTGRWGVDVLTGDDRLVGRVRFRVYR